MEDLQKSIDSTKSCIHSSFQSRSPSEVSLEFITNERLKKPAFRFLHALIILYVQRLSFAQDLYDDDELDVENVKKRQEKIRFVFKMLVYVANVTQERVDIYVSPAKLLAGQEVFATHFFLRCLAKASGVSTSVSMPVVEMISKVGVGELYKKSVKTRNIIIKLQAIVRGKFSRKKMIGGNRRSNAIVDGVMQSLALENNNTSNISVGNASGGRIVEESSLTDIIVGDETESRTRNLSCCKEDRNKTYSQNGEEGITSTSTSQSVVRRNIHTCNVSTNSNMTTSTSKEEETNIKGKDDKRTNGKSRNKPIKKTSGEVKYLKKCKVVNGVVSHHVLEVVVPKEKQEEEELKKMQSITELEVEMKRKMKCLKEREAKLNNRIEEIKQKEEHLKAHEERVKRLADNLRKQHDRLKQEGLRQAMEMDKLRLEASCRHTEHRFEPFREKKEMHFSDDLLRQACGNPTITDLRLVLEKKERQMRKRQEKITRVEMELRQRIQDFEDTKLQEQKKTTNDRQMTDFKSHPNNGVHFAVLKKRKKRNVEQTSETSEESPSIFELVNETNRRRQAFVPATIPKGLVESFRNISTPPKQTERPPVTQITMSSLKRHVLSTIAEDGKMKKRSVLKPKDSLPRSLINYTNQTNICNENSGKIC